MRDYLYNFSGMAELSKQVVDLVLAQFDSGIHLSLEIYHDIETSEEYLALYVRQNQYDSDIIKKIKQIRQRYRGLAIETAGRLLLTTDFKSPR